MLWRQYVFRTGDDVSEMWDGLYERKPVRLLYIAGRGFDDRARVGLEMLLENFRSNQRRVEKAELLLIGFSGYELSEELQKQTDENASAMIEAFKVLGRTLEVSIGTPADEDDDNTAGTILRSGVQQALGFISDQTDVVLDVSSLPRAAYLALMTALLQRFIPNKSSTLSAGGVNFQVLVAEDAALDGHIIAEDLRSELVYVPGFSAAMHSEAFQDLPLVWFPMLGENRVNQLKRVLTVIPDAAEICPVLPHPSRDLGRADRLLVEYRTPLFDEGRTSMANVVYAHEANPFEAYRQVLGAMKRYRQSLGILGGCRLVVTPLASKLMTVGAGLACFEMRQDEGHDLGVAIPYAEPTRYSVIPTVRAPTSGLSSLLLTGEAYSPE